MPTGRAKGGKPLRFDLCVKKSAIDGFGAFALVFIPAGRKIGEYEGERISRDEARRRASSQERVSIIEFGRNAAIDGARHGNITRFVNHSCSPNTYTRCLSERVEFYALRDIEGGEELTCHYGQTHHQGARACTCRSQNCRGYL